MMILKCVRNKGNDNFIVGGYYLAKNNEINGDLVYTIEEINYINNVVADGLKFEEVEIKKVTVINSDDVFDIRMLGKRYGKFVKGREVYEGEELYYLKTIKHPLMKGLNIFVCLNNKGEVILIDEKGVKFTRIESNKKFRLKNDFMIFRKGTIFKVFGEKNKFFVIPDELNYVEIEIYYKDFYDNFEEIVEKWSKWTFTTSHIGWYRIKGNRIEYSTGVKGKGFRGVATCSSMDEFNIEKGINIARTRAEINRLNNKLKDLTK